MRHQVRKKSLGRTTSHRLAMFRNMVTSLIEYESITTTLPKAKQLRTYIDKMVTLGKKNTLHAKRQALSFLRGRQSVDKLFNEIAPRYGNRPGGYSRIFKVGYRNGDNAPLAIIELIDAKTKTKEKSKAVDQTSESK